MRRNEADVPNLVPKIAPGNAGWPVQFRYRGGRHQPRVPELTLAAFTLPMRVLLPRVLRSLPGMEFSSEHVWYRRDALPCCCAPKPPARIFPGSRRFLCSFRPGVAVAVERDAMNAKLPAT